MLLIFTKIAQLYLIIVPNMKTLFPYFLNGVNFWAYYLLFSTFIFKCTLGFIFFQKLYKHPFFCVTVFIHFNFNLKRFAVQFVVPKSTPMTWHICTSWGASTIIGKTPPTGTTRKKTPSKLVLKFRKKLAKISKLCAFYSKNKKTSVEL